MILRKYYKANVPELIPCVGSQYQISWSPSRSDYKTNQICGKRTDGARDAVSESINEIHCDEAS
jgi:hypothetical protein